MLSDTTPIGFIGLGAMGGRMSRNLVKAGYRVSGYDIRPEAVEVLVKAGGKAGANAADVVRRSEIVLTSLVSHVLLHVAEEALLPNAHAGQVFLDHSTIPAPEARRLAGAFAVKGAVYLDAPVSGWITGAESGMLTIFAGGDEQAVRGIWPLLEVLGDPQRIFYAGAAGQGQVMKVVQQLKSRILDMARLEVMAFGIRDGLSWEQVLAALNVTADSEDGYAQLYRTIQAGKGDTLGILFGEWPYYLAEAAERGIPMPILSACYEFFRHGEVVTHDEQGRAGPSLWRELITRQVEEKA
jgi:3-hydroxyisobutyrate dehydrogenase-like beta-hydroxyacid dehydrogenase